MPTLVQFRNFARSTLAAGLSSGDTTLIVTTTHGARFPSLSGGQYFYLVLENASLVREVVKVTARATDSMTIVRAQDSTTAVAWNVGDIVSLRIVAAAMTDAFSSVMNTADNLAGLANVSTARTNLGLGSAATRTALGSTGSLYSRDSIIAAVGQTAGVPTGGVIENGANANGLFTRWADGTLVCYRDLSMGLTNVGLGSIWQTAAASGSWPATFVSAPYVSAQVANASGATCWAGSVTKTTTGYSALTAISVINTASCNMDLIAVGRWF